jgi:hypothetical protein
MNQRILGPPIATLAGAAATWALVHLHFLALFHVTHDQVASAIAQALTFVSVTVVTYVAHHTAVSEQIAATSSAPSSAIDPPPLSGGATPTPTPQQGA